ncbi:uncharacterized protein J3D65DRAFT_674540 [Phyllosticta citribraziliensis]|uniref:Uncharacterized protein n=1 Tax=Phyllosticta citribraziliensis TaxID=989973 RepID=A0ABR1M880_9PEZI
MSFMALIEKLRQLFRRATSQTALEPPEYTLLDPRQNHESSKKKRVFRLCKHMELDYDQMCSMKDYGPGISCASCDPSVRSKKNKSSRVGKNHLQRMGSCFVHVNDFKLSGVESAVLLPIKRIQGRLANDTTKICPHIRFCDLDFERMRSKHAKLTLTPIPTSYNSCRPQTVSGKCKTRYCRTEFEFSWNNYPSEKQTVDFESKREFGMDGPSGRAWLANSEAVPETSASQSGKIAHPKDADLKGSTTHDLV